MNIKLPLNPRTELFKWGPIPGRFFYTSAFIEVNYRYFCQKYLGESWAETLFLFKDGQMIWLNEYSALRASGEKVFLKYMLPTAVRKREYNNWKKIVARLEKIEKEIAGSKLNQLSSHELLRLWQRFHRVYLEFWTLGTAPELGNYSADQLFEKMLRNYISGEADITEAREALAAPVKLSFYQEEEINLSQSSPEEHFKKYFWLNNSYAGVKSLAVSFFRDRKKELSPNLKEELVKKLDEIKKRKLAVAKKYHLPKSVADCGRAIADCIAWQDERKKFIFIALYYQNLMLKEAAHRFRYSPEDLLNCWFWEIEKIMKGENLHKKLRTRRTDFGVHFYKKYFRNLSPQEVKYFWKVFATEQPTRLLKELNGLVVSRGSGENVVGYVRIVLDPLKTGLFKKGEILVAPMTSPEYIFVMRKAAAIITDEGGLTSHAAIVSRELNIPCVVGTKFATKILKNGARVEIDVTAGIVKLI